MFYKEKGFYVSLLCGAVALVAIAVICLNLTGGTEDGNGDTPIAAVESPTPMPSAIPDTREASINKAKSEVKEEKKTEEPTKKKATLKPLHFDQETGLLWPVQGKVLMQYSPEKVVYFKTLAQYRTNPALIISAKKGTAVKSSADGIVKDISTSEETGRTVMVTIGNGFTVSYGQLKEVAVGKGDTVTEGQVLGKVADPTKYYAVEGANLFFQVKQNKTTVNPMDLLR